MTTEERGHELSLSQLRQIGRELGFDAIGATTTDPFPELVPKLESYAKRGATGFEWSDVGARVDPRAFAPEAKSLIAVAMAYLTKEGHQLAHQHRLSGRDKGNVTVYCYGDDYHAVMERRLKRLAERLEEHLGRPVLAKAVVDTGPFVDRRVAERAGVGWVGKNCMLYTEEHGSFVFLGTLAVDVDIEPAKSDIAPQCHDCTRCLDACPTGALIAPGVIDAKRCLSYVTQMKGIIPEEFRAPLGRRVFGCDTCQWACPENRDVDFSLHEEYLPKDELAFPQLVEILGWSNREFTRRYGQSAGAWRGVQAWKRNALIALGNAKNEAAIPHILPFLRHDRKELRASAAWALRRINPEATRGAVGQALEVESDPEIASEMAWAQGR